MRNKQHVASTEESASETSPGVRKRMLICHGMVSSSRFTALKLRGYPVPWTLSSRPIISPARVFQVVS